MHWSEQYVRFPRAGEADRILRELCDKCLRAVDYKDPAHSSDPFFFFNQGFVLKRTFEFVFLGGRWYLLLIGVSFNLTSFNKQFLKYDPFCVLSELILGGSFKDTVSVSFRKVYIYTCCLKVCFEKCYVIRSELGRLWMLTVSHRQWCFTMSHHDNG